MESQENIWMKSSSGFADLQPSLYEDLTVGPGQYTLKSGIPSGPSYSFPKSCRFSTPPGKGESQNLFETPQKEGNPSQNPRNLDFSPSRFKMQLDHSPGPGEYDLSSTLYNQKMTLGGKFREISNSATPGPGHYEVQAKSSSGIPFLTEKRMKDFKSVTSNVDFCGNSLRNSGPSYSMGQKLRSSSAPSIPGPGSYELPGSLLSKPFTIMPKREPLSKLDTPGPGSYNLDLLNESQRYSIGLPYSPERANEVPGPGQYSLDLKSESPSYSMRQKFQEKQKFDPRDFGEVRTSLTSQAPLLRGKPKDPPSSKIPGPGEYSLPERKPEGFSQSRSNRFSEIESSPGPGDYSTGRPSKGLNYSFSSSQRFFKAKSSSPGPGAYDEKTIDRSLKITLRGKPKEEPTSKTPGPGSYSLDKPGKSSSFPFGRKFEQNFENGVPGPGAYSVTQRSSSPVWTISERRNLNKCESLPGPGAYDGEIRTSVVSYSFTLKKEQKIEKTPGPGDYEILEKKTTGFTFGQKFEETVDETPGPGSYEAKPRNSSPSWTIHPRRSLKKEEVFPSPGQYSLPRTSSAQAISFSRLERKFSPSKTPAPTDYNVNPSSLNNSIKYSVGRSQRIDFTKLKGKTPGPGSYYKENNSKVLAAKFGTAKRESKFLVNNTAPFIKCELKPSGPFYSISGKRSERSKNNTPGPGAYNNNLQFKPSSPAFTMGAKRNLKKKGKIYENYTPIRSRK